MAAAPRETSSARAALAISERQSVPWISDSGNQSIQATGNIVAPKPVVAQERVWDRFRGFSGAERMPLIEVP
jgi:hypothetical protein